MTIIKVNLNNNNTLNLETKAKRRKMICSRLTGNINQMIDFKLRSVPLKIHFLPAQAVTLGLSWSIWPRSVYISTV
jgi:hypothetical protein